MKRKIENKNGLQELIEWKIRVWSLGINKKFRIPGGMIRCSKIKINMKIK